MAFYKYNKLIPYITMLLDNIQMSATTFHINYIICLL